MFVIIDTCILIAQNVCDGICALHVCHRYMRMLCHLSLACMTSLYAYDLYAYGMSSLHAYGMSSLHAYDMPSLHAYHSCRIRLAQIG